MSIAATLDLATIALAIGAFAITIHVLLTKTDVREAIGWIGLAWLSPIAGAVLYVLFGINRVQRKAVRLRRKVHDTAIHTPASAKSVDMRPLESIAAVGTQLTGREVAAGNDIRILAGGNDCYPAMLSAIEQSFRSIALSTYIMRNDEVGRKFIDALAKARRRGVEVCVLLDGFGSGYLWSPAARAMETLGIRTARFLHFARPWKMPFINLRNHKKLLIVDGSIGFTGGMNIGGENLSTAPERRRVADIHFKIAGPVVGQMMETFAEDWLFATGDRLSGAAWRSGSEPAGTVKCRGIGSGPDEEIGKIEMMLSAAVGAARQRIAIVTPYFLPDQKLTADLLLAALRGVEINIVVPRRTDFFLIDWAMRAQIDLLLRKGIKFHFSPEPFDHSKMMAVDGLWSAIGSANWDMRSLRLNFEYILECYDASFANEIHEIIRRKIGRARAVPISSAAEKAIMLRLRNAAARLFLPYL